MESYLIRRCPFFRTNSCYSKLLLAMLTTSTIQIPSQISSQILGVNAQLVSSTYYVVISRTHRSVEANDIHPYFCRGKCPVQSAVYKYTKYHNCRLAIANDDWCCNGAGSWEFRFWYQCQIWIRNTEVGRYIHLVLPHPSIVRKGHRPQAELKDQSFTLALK